GTDCPGETHSDVAVGHGRQRGNRERRTTVAPRQSPGSGQAGAAAIPDHARWREASRVSREAERAVGTGAVDRQQGEPVDGARAGQSRLALALWAGFGALDRQFRPAEREAEPSGTAGLAGLPVHRQWLVDQGTASAHCAIGYVPENEYLR